MRTKVLAFPIKNVYIVQVRLDERGKFKKMKSFYSGINICKELLAQNEKDYPIRLEYYRIKNEETNERKCYGIEIVKIEHINNKPKVEVKTIEHIADDEQVVNKFLDTLEQGYVTPVTVNYIIDDYFKER